MVEQNLLQQIVSMVVWTVLGVLAFGLSFWVITLVSPFSIRKEIEDDQNTALAVIIGAVIVGLAIIIASIIRS